jgi:hypothetical protein
MAVALVQKAWTHFFPPARYDWVAYVNAEPILLSAIFPPHVHVRVYTSTGVIPIRSVEYTHLSWFKVCLPSDVDNADYMFGTVKLLIAEGSCIATDCLQVIH